ncbi:MAG TPA: methyltransferase domain-containing protein [Alphaproteobacteria bacterium]|jgi:O-methyltransferase
MTVPDAPVTQIEKPQPAFEDCQFYHTVDLPNGTVHGQWDLRPNVDAYLGNVDFQDRSVLEIGPASGFLSFHMEKHGARVTALEPSMEHLWDVVPLRNFSTDKWRKEFATHITGVRNSFWYLHHLHKSQVRLIETVPEKIPDAAGDFDIGILAAVLLHTRSPFLILESVAQRVRDTIVVTELHDVTLGEQSVCRLLPHPDFENFDTWWSFSPAFFVNALRLLGFPHTTVNVHYQKREFDGALITLFTVVGRRHA